MWPHHVSGTTPLSFFAYSVRSARCALVSRQSEHPTRLRMWIHAGLDHLFLRQFWSALWRLHVAARICYFLWMVVHAGLAVGVWSSSMGHDPTCQRCLQEPESISHCLWACPASVDVWRAVSLLMSRAGVQHGSLTWGSVSWIHPAPGPHLCFDNSDRDPVYMLTPSGYLRGCMSMLRPLPSHTAIGPRDEVFSAVVSSPAPPVASREQTPDTRTHARTHARLRCSRLGTFPGCQQLRFVSPGFD